MNDSPVILVVDDETLVRQTLAETLDAEGYNVLQAPSAGIALEVIAGRYIDAFLLDIEMPGISGIELCTRIRQLPQHQATPIIFLTGSGAAVTLNAAFAAGCDDFIDKPFNAVELRARLRGHLARMNYFRQLDRTRRMLNQYLSRRTLEVVDTVARSGVLPPPEERTLSILFTDIRGFTALSEDTSPGELFNLVSSTLSEQVDRVHEYGGYIDKFGGDGVMAIFDTPDMVVQSCLCALRIVAGAHAQFRTGIGIHTGRVVIGNIGSPEHLDYSAIGTSVNIAARLCGQAEATSIVVSKTVRDAASGDPRLRFHSERAAHIKGIKNPLTIYTLSHS
jgi:adenylate cyclase